jgi:glycosyltransferase involved in cell wall biosynthesis
MHSRIIHIDSGTEWRGGQRQLYLLALEQRARGGEPLVVSQPRSRLVTRLRAAGIASAGVRMRASWDIAAVRRLRRVLRMWHPEIVHVHDVRSLALAQAVLVGMNDVTLVVTCRAVPTKTRALSRMGQRAARFIAPNAGIARFLLALGVPASKVDVVHPGVPPHRDVRPRDWHAECRWPRAAVVCGVIGVSSAKTSAALRGVLENLGPGVRERLRLVVLGGQSSGATKIASTPTFCAGFVDDIPAAIAGMDILCNFSGPDSMSTAVLDAMGLGVPPVAFMEGGAGEYIEHGRSGLVVADGDSVAFAAALSSLVEDEELRDTLAAFGPGRASRFGVASLADATEFTYRAATGTTTVRIDSASA